MKSADMIIKRIEDKGAEHFEPRCKSSFMLGMAYGEIRQLVSKLAQFEDKAAHFITFNGIDLGVDGYHQPEEKMTHWHPGCPEAFEVHEVFHCGQEITALFTEEQLEEIGNLVLEKIQEVDAAAAYDYAVARYEEMRGAA